MDRTEVLAVIGGERDYQEFHKEQGDTHIVEDFPLGSAIVAIEHNMDKLKNSWYTDKAPYKPETLQYLRKVAAICVQMGEKYGMPEREDFGA